ncbi:MAG: hypothetical protein RBU30_11130 [Polyangia bacterium]|jgi:hypothetical protein|nr:hypothetical protein [Polyangia bacterium]
MSSKIRLPRCVATLGHFTAWLAFVLASILLVVGFRGQALFQRASFPDELDRYYLPPPAVLEVASLGYREAAADLLWVATIQHGSDRRIQRGGRFPFLEQYLDATLALNPYMLKVYLWADGTLTYARGRMRNSDWQTTIRYLERGHRAFPKNWEILFKLSSAYTELRPRDEPERARLRRTAADYLWKAHLVGGGPPWLASLAARYWSEEGRWHLAYRRTIEELKATEDEKVKAEMAERLADLLSQAAGGAALSAHFARLSLPYIGNPAAPGLVLAGEILQARQVWAESESQVREVEEGRQAFDEAHLRCLPYGPANLFVLLGSCPSPSSGASARGAARAPHRQVQ